MEVVCKFCDKAFDFDPETTKKSEYVELSAAGGSGATYFPACPHCGKFNRVTARPKEKS